MLGTGGPSRHRRLELPNGVFVVDHRHILDTGVAGS